MGANKIYLAGFDGYSSDDIRKKEIAELLNFLQEVHGTQNIISLTETQYSIKTLSVFGMLDASIF